MTQWPANAWCIKAGRAIAIARAQHITNYLDHSQSQPRSPNGHIPPESVRSANDSCPHYLLQRLDCRPNSAQAAHERPQRPLIAALCSCPFKRPAASCEPWRVIPVTLRCTDAKLAADAISAHSINRRASKISRASSQTAAPTAAALARVCVINCSSARPAIPWNYPGRLMPNTSASAFFTQARAGLEPM